MNDANITMNKKEFDLLHMCIRIHEVTKTIQEASEYLNVSYQTMQRRLARFGAEVLSSLQ